MKNKILTVLCVLFGLMMLNAGLNKFFNYMPMPEMSEEMMQVMGALVAIKWIFPLVAIIEIIGGILIAIPKTRALG
ncbi:DoxX family membrane protein, partial [Belliella marina]